MESLIDVFYDGRSPYLCLGTLKVITPGRCWIFPIGSLVPRDEYLEEEDGDYWTLSYWPANFPEDLKDIVLDKVNAQIPWGCCGGCRS